MIFVPFFPHPGSIRKDGVVYAHTMENSSNSPRETREPAPLRRTWRGCFQRALPRVSKFFRRGRGSTGGWDNGSPRQGPMHSDQDLRHLRSLLSKESCPVMSK
uniref:Uncharacterized protein n=1 Tax=Rattus norvegicus TaxID=10116 RepID=A0A8I6AIA3_RAT